MSHAIHPRIVALATLLLAGCGADPTATEREGASSLIAFQSGDVVVGSIVYGCDEGFYPKVWQNLPSGDPLLLDLFFTGRGSPDQPNTGPWEEHLDAVRAAGGEVVHEYNVIAARARVPRSALHDVAEVLNLARAVPRPDRYDLFVSVVFDEGSETSVTRRFEELGGQVARVYTHFPVLDGGIPDAGVPALRSHPGVVSVENGDTGWCFH